MEKHYRQGFVISQVATGMTKPEFLTNGKNDYNNYEVIWPKVRDVIMNPVKSNLTEMATTHQHVTCQYCYA
ncbi:hypothetical protein C5167_022549 [Papaver somniferum]|uniref:Uncharacterized protein n=1 Tax=Papaver somniferum TaxID=3469 RepID=A0A4Y7JLX6_PAPSO|nr:hypothetical protein C5167_022549 [Papaver somniferum]